MFLFSHLGSCANPGLITVNRKMGHCAGPFLRYMPPSVGGEGRMWEGWLEGMIEQLSNQGKVLIPEKRNECWRYSKNLLHLLLDSYI